MCNQTKSTKQRQEVMHSQQYLSCLKKKVSLKFSSSQLKRTSLKQTFWPFFFSSSSTLCKKALVSLRTCHQTIEDLINQQENHKIGLSVSIKRNFFFLEDSPTPPTNKTNGQTRSRSQPIKLHTSSWEKGCEYRDPCTSAKVGSSHFTTT